MFLTERIVHTFTVHRLKRSVIFCKRRDCQECFFRAQGMGQQKDQLCRSISKNQKFLGNLQMFCQCTSEFPAFAVRILPCMLQIFRHRQKHLFSWSERIEVDRVVRHVFISINISAMPIFHDFVSFLTRNTRTGSFLQTAG